MPNAIDADKYVGSLISFLFYPGWEEPEEMAGWLHGVTRSDPADQDQMVWLHISTDRDLPPGTTLGELGGYGLTFNREFTVLDTPASDKRAATRPTSTAVER